MAQRIGLIIRVDVATRQMLKSSQEIIYMTYANKLLQQLRRVIQNKTNFPYGTLLYFGPDDINITKIVAVVIQSPKIDPVLKSWSGSEISTDPHTIAEIGNFLKQYSVTEVIMPEGVIGCPHEEGIDYPEGENCPNCPYWAERLD